MKYTLKYWRTEQDYDKGESNVLSTDMSSDDAMSVVQAFQRIGKYHAYEIFETESGETYYHSEE